MADSWPSKGEIKTVNDVVLNKLLSDLSKGTNVPRCVFSQKIVLLRVNQQNALREGIEFANLSDDVSCLPGNRTCLHCTGFDHQRDVVVVPFLG